jgi:integrase-like protein
LKNATDSDGLVFHSQRGAPLLETTILSQCLHPALRALGLPRAGFHAFRRGCNRRWELAGLNPAVLRQQMGHTSSAMTRLYSGELPLEDVIKSCSNTFQKQLEIMETGVAAQLSNFMERPMRIELTPEPWQGSVLPLY